jgi:hypothetical protein
MIHSSDQFALAVLKNKREGYYVELGSADPINGSTSYQLEHDYDWKGVSFELNEAHADRFNKIRTNPALCEDAIKFNYTKYFEENNFPKQIDYLQVDIDTGYSAGARALGNPASSLHGLIALPLNTYRFSVISFEHDALLNYRYNSIRDAQREILDSLGYALVQRHAHEDWWVDPEVIHYLEFREFFRVDAP